MSFKSFINFKEKFFILIKFGTKYTFLWLEGPLWNFGSLAADGLKSHIRWTGLVIWAWICFFLLWVRLILWLLTFQILSANRVRLTRPTTSLSNQWQTGSPTLLEHSQTLLSLSLSLFQNSMAERFELCLLLSYPPPPPPTAVVLSFLSLTDPLSISLKPRPKRVELLHSKRHSHKRRWFPLQSS